MISFQKKASAVSECMQVAPMGVARFAADIIGSVQPACSEVKGRSVPRTQPAAEDWLGTLISQDAIA